MGGIASVLYGVVAYALFLGTFLYAVAFVGNLPVPKTIDSGEAGPFLAALIINTLLLGLFAIQHSVMARPAFKRWWTRFVPQPVERTTYVLLASLVLVLLFSEWRAMPEPIWSVTSPTGVMVLQAVFWIGWATVLLSSFLINHFELFGLRQVYARLRGRALPAPVFRTPFLYKRVRHPLYSRWEPLVTSSSASIWRSAIWWKCSAINIAAIASRYRCSFRFPHVR